MGTGRLVKIIAGLVLIATGLFVGASIVTYCPYEGPFADFSAEEYPRAADGSMAQPPKNVCGIAGSYVSAYALVFLGWTSGAAALAAVVLGALLVTGVRPAGWPGKAVGVVIGLAALTIALAYPRAAPTMAGVTPWHVGDMSSGTAGMLLTTWLFASIGRGGTLMLLLLLGSISVFLLADGRLVALCARAWRRLRPAPGKPGRVRRVAKGGAMPEGIAAVADLVGEDDVEQPPVTEPARVPASVPEPAPEDLHVVPPPDHGATFEPEIVTRAGLATKLAAQEAEALRRRQPVEAVPSEGQYELPPLDVLDSFDDSALEEDEDDIRQKGVILARTLGDFKIDARVVRVQRGPVITMYELALAAGTKVAKVESLADDLAIALKAPNVRIVAPLPGKNTIGIEVPKTQRELVSLRELIEQMDKKTSKMAIPLFLGRDTAGTPLIIDLSQAPHLLLAGATGSGKSVAVNSIISSILMTRTPHEVQFLLVDPKSVEFSDYRRLPHLMCPVLTDMKKAAAVLQWACKKMDDRYSVLSRTGVRDIAAYNKLGQEEIVRRLDPEEDAQIDDVPFYMPHIVIVVDELGELMMVAAKEVESSVIRLSQKARAVGIHLICATQRPSVDVITGLIKANLPGRIAFHVASKVDSRTILDRNGAELLLGRGDMLMLPPGSSRLVRAQGTFVSPQETPRLAGFWEEQGGPQYRTDLREYHASAGSESETDDLYKDAVQIVLETRRGSVSLLQRRLSIGYSRAARLIDLMAEAGVVGSYKGSQAREVMLTLEEWEAARRKTK